MASSAVFPLPFLAEDFLRYHVMLPGELHHAAAEDEPVVVVEVCLDEEDCPELRHQCYACYFFEHD